MRLTEQTGIEQRPAQKGVGSTEIKNARDTKWQMQTVVTAECCAQELITLFFLLCAWVKLLIPNRKAGLLGEVEVTVSYFTYISVKMEMQCSRSAHKSVQDIREARRRASCASCGLVGSGAAFPGQSGQRQVLNDSLRE